MLQNAYKTHKLAVHHLAVEDANARPIAFRVNLRGLQAWSSTPHLVPSLHDWIAPQWHRHCAVFAHTFNSDRLVVSLRSEFSSLVPCKSAIEATEPWP